jgi:hypothetical protein
MFHLYRPEKNPLFFLFIATILLGSCTVVKNYPVNTPFVFENKITVEGDVSKDEKKRLEFELYNYWDDSLKVNSLLQFGVRTIIKNPNVFDSAGINRSIVFMNSYLNSQGYYNTLITPAPITIDTVEDQLRTTVKMDIDVNTNLKIDSVIYDSLNHPELNKLAVDNKKQSVLAKNKPFTKALISSELDRLTSLFRSKGFYKFTRDNIYAEVDTTDVSLLEITLDPFEQARRIAEAEARRKADPTINVVIKQRLSQDTNAFTKFWVGKINYYPETLINQAPDSLMNQTFPIVITDREFTLKQSVPIIKMRPLRERTYLKEGQLYDEQDYFKTVNAFSQLGPWNQVDVRTVHRKDSTDILDFHFFLTPAPKYSFGYDIEVSRNSGSIISGNLLGISNVLTLRNRNVWKRAIQSSTNIRAVLSLVLPILFCKRYRQVFLKLIVLPVLSLRLE